MTDDLTLIREVYKLIYFTKPILAAEIIALVESATRAKIADEIQAACEADIAELDDAYSGGERIDFDEFRGWVADSWDIAARVARGESDE